LPGRSQLYFESTDFAVQLTPAAVAGAAKTPTAKPETVLKPGEFLVTPSRADRRR
jgi:hypothetical protein